jgi:hypothetical protein
MSRVCDNLTLSHVELRRGLTLELICCISHFIFFIAGLHTMLDLFDQLLAELSDDSDARTAGKRNKLSNIANMLTRR